MFYVDASLLVLLNLVCLSLTLAGLPGIWLMIGVSLLFARFIPSTPPVAFDTWTLIVVVVIATLGELLELLAGVTGSKRSGGSRWGAVGALLGGMLGALFGTFTLPIPGLSTLAGAVIGAFCGATSLELATGHPHRQALRSGRGAAIGHFVGIMTKFSLGCLVWLILAVAAFRT